MQQIPLFEVPAKQENNRAAHTTTRSQARAGAARAVSDQPHVRQVIERAVEVMGVIDQDVYCLYPETRARTHLFPEDNALIEKWSGRVWLNAPPGRAVAKWAEKLAREFEYGEVTEAVALFPARTNADWWAYLKRYPFCAIRGRLTIIKGEGREGTSASPGAVVYLGSQLARFATIFEKMGVIYIPYLE